VLASQQSVLLPVEVVEVGVEVVLRRLRLHVEAAEAARGAAVAIQLRRRRPAAAAVAEEEAAATLWQQEVPDAEEAAGPTLWDRWRRHEAAAGRLGEEPV
jgi:hypothetical protein